MHRIESFNITSKPQYTWTLVVNLLSKEKNKENNRIAPEDVAGWKYRKRLRWNQTMSAIYKNAIIHTHQETEHFSKNHAWHSRKNRSLRAQEKLHKHSRRVEASEVRTHSNRRKHWQKVELSLHDRNCTRIHDKLEAPPCTRSTCLPFRTGLKQTFVSVLLV